MQRRQGGVHRLGGVIRYYYEDLKSYPVVFGIAHVFCMQSRRTHPTG